MGGGDVVDIEQRLGAATRGLAHSLLERRVVDQLPELGGKIVRVPRATKQAGFTGGDGVAAAGP